MKKVLSIVLVLYMSMSVAQEKYHSAKIYYQNKANFMALMNHGLPMDHGHHNDDDLSFESDFSDSDLEIVKQLGLKYEIIINDVQQFYLDRNNPNSPHFVSKEDALLPEFSCNGTTSDEKWPTPKNWSYGSMAGFLTYEELLQELDDMYQYCQDNDIDIITKRADNINPNDPNDFKTVEGRYQQWVKISDNASNDDSDSEPQMLYTSIHHAREVMSLQQLVFYMWYLIEHYKTDPEIKALIDNTEIFFIPCLNPDGYIYNQTSKPNGGGMHRKNRNGRKGDRNYGVDLNRNYSYIDSNGRETWNTAGTSNDRTNDTYAGTGPFSEAETRAMRYFIETHNFEIAINNHSYSDLLLLPFGYAKNKKTPDHDLFMALSEEMVKENGYTNQLSADLYPAAGVSDDFIYGNLKTVDGGTRNKIYSMTPEIGNSTDRFWPARNRIEPISKGMMYHNLTALKAARNYAELTDESPFLTDKTAFSFKFSLKRIGVKDDDFKISIEPVSPNIESVGDPKVISGLTYGTSKTDEIAINLKSTIKSGDGFTFKVHNDNGKYITTQTITKVFGEPNIVFEDNANDLGNWESDTWEITTNEFKSDPSSITDSKNGRYANNTTAYVTLKESSALDLTNASITDAILSFHAKWDIQKNKDYTQLEASTNGSTWTPLCGKYTTTGSKDQKGASGEPVYDGTQSSWVEESISLSDYIGETVQLRFSLVSDARTNADGFYFDDVKLAIIGGGLSTNEHSLDKFIAVYPNPVNAVLNLNTTLKNYSYELSNIQGQVLLNSTSNTGNTSIDYSHYSQGVYFLNILANGKQKTFKIVKQ